jgi:hypothetical protein
VERKSSVPVEDLIKQWADLAKAFDDPFKAGETVYHYTSAEGFRGIVASSEIWLTNTAFVNDTTECRAFGSLGRDDVLGSGPFPNEHVEKKWEEFHKKTPYEDSIYYVASFSKAKDLLEQWRAYGSFCIGFEASKLVKTGFYLHDCVYSALEIKDWVRRKSCIEQWAGDCLRDDHKEAAALDLLFAASVKYKSRYYEAEKEVRLVSVSNHDLRTYRDMLEMFETQPPIHFRDHHAHGLPVPYVRFFLADHMLENDRPDRTARETPMAMRIRKLEREKKQPRGLLPITEVRIGPMMRQKEARIACEILLQAKGYENVAVNASDIPYRGS